MFGKFCIHVILLHSYYSLLISNCFTRLLIKKKKEHDICSHSYLYTFSDAENSGKFHLRKYKICVIKNH